MVEDSSSARNTVEEVSILFSDQVYNDALIGTGGTSGVGYHSNGINKDLSIWAATDVVITAGVVRRTVV